jgi:hypothetical protein
VRLALVVSAAASFAAAGFSVASVAAGADAQADTLCDRFVALGDVRDVESADLGDVSGLAASRAHPGVLWAVNDRSGTIALVALDLDGEDRGRYSIEGIEHRDWEAAGIGPGPDPDRSYLYIGDIGDNEADRPFVSVIRVPEPRIAPDGNPRVLSGAEVVSFVYPDGPHDAEALVVDPLTGEMLVIHKVVTGDADVYRVPSDGFGTDRPVEAERVGSVSIDLPDDLDARPGTQITDAAVSPDGSIVLVRTYDSVRAHVNDGDLAGALAGAACLAPAPAEVQGEAITVVADGTAYVTISETAGALADGRLPEGTPPALTGVMIDPAAGAASTTTIPDGAGSDSSERSPLVLALLGGGLGLLVLLAVVGLARTRRR